MPEPSADLPSILDVRDGRLLVAGEAVQAVAGGMAAVALPWLVLARGGGPTAAAIATACLIAPYALVGIPAAIAAERLPRRLLIGLSYLAQAVAAAVIPLAAALGAPVAFPLVVAVALVFGVARVIVDAAIFGAVPSIVGREGVPRATTLLSTTWALGFLAGPALGGLVIALVGPVRTLAGVAAGYVVAACVVRLLGAAVERRLAEDATNGALVRAGVRLMVRDAEIRRFTVVGLAWNMLSGGFNALAIPFLEGPLGLHASAAGGVLATYGAAGMLVPLVLGRLDARFPDGRLFVLLTGASGVMLALLGRADGALAALLAIAPLGLCNMSLGTLLPVARQRRAPLALQSLIGTTGRSMMIWAYSGGSLAAGVTAGIVGVRETLALVAVLLACTAAAGVPVLWRLPRARMAASG